MNFSLKLSHSPRTRRKTASPLERAQDVLAQPPDQLHSFSSENPPPPPARRPPRWEASTCPGELTRRCPPSLRG